MVVHRYQSQRIVRVFGRVVHSHSIVNHTAEVDPGFSVCPSLVTCLSEAVAEGHDEQIENRVHSARGHIREEFGVAKQEKTL